MDELKNQLTQAKDGLNQSQNRSMELAKEARESKELVKRLQGELEMAKASKGRLEDELEGMQRDRMQASQQSQALDQATRHQDQLIQGLQAQLQKAKQDEQEFMRMSAQSEARASATQVTIASLEHQLSELRSQNAILQARLEVHPSKRSEDGGREMVRMV